jgi:signal transduction histidine kinase
MPRTVRGRLTALAVLASALAIGLLTLVFNVVLDRSLSGDADRRLRAQAAAASTTVVQHGGRLVVRESADDGVVDRLVWVYQGARALERPPEGPTLQAAADRLARRAHAFAELPAQDVRLYAAPITVGGRQLGTVVAAESLAPYERTTSLALTGSLALAAVLLGAVFVVTRLAIGRALGPVHEMTRQAAEWSEHDEGRRFGAGDRPDELGELARTFDGLLDRVAASIRHEQQLSAELSHELRTPLARVVAEIELLRRRERPSQEREQAHASIARSAEQMSQILETLMSVARLEAQVVRGRGDVGAALASVAANWDRTPHRGDLALEVRPVADGLTAGVDQQVVERIVAPLVENANRFARSRVVLSADRTTEALIVRVADDGPGVAAPDRERVFDAGVRLPAADRHAGAGLGLPLVRRLARAAGGDVSIGESEAGGAEVRVSLPI